MSENTNPEPTPESPASPSAPEGMIPKERYDELLARHESQSRTLEQIQQDMGAIREAQATTTVQPQIASQALADLNEVMAKEMGWNPEEVLPHTKLIDRYATHFFTNQLMPILNPMADKVNELEARLTISDYDNYEDEINAIRKERADSGQYASHRESYFIARGRRAPEDIAKATAAAAPTEPSTTLTDSDAPGVAKAGPTGGTSHVPPTAEDLKSMTPEERLQQLEELDSF